MNTYPTLFDLDCEPTPRHGKVEEGDLKADPKTGLQLIRYCGRWVPRVAWFDCDGVHCTSYDLSGNHIELRFEGRYLVLPNGRRTSFYYH